MSKERCEELLKEMHNLVVMAWNGGASKNPLASIAAEQAMWEAGKELADKFREEATQ